MRKLILTVLLLLLFTGIVAAADAEITDIDQVVTVQNDASCQVEVNVVIDFREKTEELWIPLGSEVKNISLAGWKYKVRTVGDVTGIVIQNSSGFSGKQGFSYSYKMKCRAALTGSTQTFTIKLPEGGWEYPISKYGLKVIFPVEVKNAPQWSSGYYSSTIDNYLNIEIDGTTVTAVSNTPMQDHETVTMKITFPKGTFNLKNRQGKTTDLDMVLFVLLLLGGGAYWFLFLNRKLLRPKNQRQVSMESCAGEVPCQMFGENPDIGGIIAHWGNLGYITVYRDELGRLMIRKSMDMGNERKPAEQKLFAALFRNTDVLDPSSRRFREVERKSRKIIRKAWSRRLFETKSGNPKVLRLIGIIAGGIIGLMTFDKALPADAGRWIVLPILTGVCAVLNWGVQYSARTIFHRRAIFRWALGLLCIVLLFVFARIGKNGVMMFINLLYQVFISVVTLFGGKRNSTGEERAREWLGLRRFFRKMEKTSIERYTRLDSQYFYRMLPFADCMGVGRAFAKNFSNQKVEECQWLKDARLHPSGSEDFYELYSVVMAEIRGEMILRTADLTDKTERKS